MRKMWTVAWREYKAAVRTKTFLLSLLIMPVLMGASVVLQWLLRDVVDVRDKAFVAINRSQRPEWTEALKKQIDGHNARTVDPKTGVQTKPRFAVEFVAPSGPAEEDVNRQRYDMSQRVRNGQLKGFLELLDPEPAAGKDPARVVVRYQTNRPTETEFATLAQSAMSQHVRLEIIEKAGLEQGQANALVTPVRLESKGLSTRDETTGKIAEPADQARFGSLIVPMVLMLLMFMVVLMTSTPLMQGVLEEKMQRIAEVLLGSVQPFQLMMGKLLGSSGVSLTIAGVYLSGAYWAARYFGFGEYLTPDLIVWFVVFQVLAALLFGSLFIAIGAACTEMKETQNMLLPVMLLASLPMFLMGSVLREPNGPVVRGLSYFPFATPTLMMARQATPPGLPLWEPLLGVLVVLATTGVCVWMAGRIFRVGLLMQGKGANLLEMVRWIVRG